LWAFWQRPIKCLQGDGYAIFDGLGRALDGAADVPEQRTLMSAGDREKADGMFEQALQEVGARDPREFYRERLAELKERDPKAYQEAVRYYEETLIPSIAAGEAEPLAAWTEYGRRLAELSVAGRTVMVDETGRASPYQGPPTPGTLVLHLPRTAGGRALLVGLPAQLSEAQRATYDWLVLGRQKLRGGE